MKYLFTITLIALLLTSCMSITESTVESTPTENSTNQEVDIPAQNASTEESSDGSVKIVGGNEESLKQFISRWLTPIYPNESSLDITVYIGSLPADLPFDIPMPDDALTIGSVEGSWPDYKLVLDTSLSLKATQDFYAQALIEKEWQKTSTDEIQGAFTAQPVVLNSGYCYHGNEAFLKVETIPMSNGNTNLHLSIYTQPETYMCQSNTSYMPPYMKVLPSLQAPSGVQVLGGGSGGTELSGEVSANLRTQLSAMELADYYNEQLQTDDWEMQDNGNEEGTAWSTWTFKDDQGNDWSGTLVVIGVPKSNDRFVVLHIEQNAKEGN